MSSLIAKQSLRFARQGLSLKASSNAVRTYATKEKVYIYSYL